MIGYTLEKINNPVIHSGLWETREGAEKNLATGWVIKKVEIERCHCGRIALASHFVGGLCPICHKIYEECHRELKGDKDE